MLNVAVLELSPLRKFLSRQDIDELLAVAGKLLGRRKKVHAAVKFAWRGYPLVARRTKERLIIEDQRGCEVCCRWQW